MKHPFFFNLFLVASILIIGCTAEKTVDAPEKESTLTQSNTISQTTFNNWSGAWEDVGAAYTDTLLTKYFTMPLIDLTEFESQPNHVAARYVLGMDTTVSPIMPHLMLVGVDSKGKSIIPDNGYPNASIYDLTLPCPQLCGPKSLPKKKK